MQRWVACIGLVLAAAAYTGCSFLVDDAGLTGTADGGSASDDGGGDVSDAASTAPDDGGAFGDAGSGDSGAIDAAADASSIPFCAARDAAFCDDFEHTSIVPPWTSVILNGDTAKLEIEPSGEPAPTRALVVSLAPSADPCSYAAAEKRITGSFDRLHVGFRLNVEPFSGRATLVSPYIGTPNNRCYAYLYDIDGALSVYGQYAQGGTTIAENNVTGMGILSSNQWVYVELDYDFATKNVTVSLDGLPITKALPYNCPLVPGDAVLQIGLACEGDPPDARRLLFDDVTFDPR